MRSSVSAEVGADRKVKREASIADHTAATKVVLWEQHVNALEEGKCYHLKIFHIKEFQSRKHLSMPKNDFEITQIDNIENTVDPPTDENEHTTIKNVQVIGVHQLDSYKCCLQCKAWVEPLTPPLGKCTKEDCTMMQLFDLCQDQTIARVLFRHQNDKGQWESITCSAFGDMVYQLANVHKDEPITKPDLLKGQKFQEVRFLTNKKIIVSILY